MFDKYINGVVLVAHAGKVYQLDYIYVDSLFTLYEGGWYKLREPLSVIHRVISPPNTTDKVGFEVPLRYCNRCYSTYMDATAAYKLHIPIVSGRHYVTVVYAVVPMARRSRVVMKLYTPDGVLLAEQACCVYFDIPGTPDVSAPVIHGLITSDEESV